MAKSAKLAKKSATQKSGQQEAQVKRQNVNTAQRRNDAVDLYQQHSIYGNHNATKSAPDLGERTHGSNSTVKMIFN